MQNYLVLIEVGILCEKYVIFNIESIEICTFISDIAYYNREQISLYNMKQ